MLIIWPCIQGSLPPPHSLPSYFSLPTCWLPGRHVQSQPPFYLFILFPLPGILYFFTTPNSFLPIKILCILQGPIPSPSPWKGHNSSSSENRFNCVSSWVTSPCHTFYGISHQGEKIVFSKILEIRLNSKSYSYFYFTFKKSEVESLVILFHGLVGKPDERLDIARLDRSTFRMVLHGLFGMTDDKLMNRGKKS